MVKTGAEIRHEAKQRMIKYRKEMTAKGYISTTVFLSEEHRAELKRLGDEHKLTRAEAAEHIFKIYLQSENKDVTQKHNINTGQKPETSAVIESFEARLKALEEMIQKQAEKMGEPEPADNDGTVLDLEINLDEIPDTEDQEKNLLPEIDLGDFEDNDSVDRVETQTEIPGPMPKPEAKAEQDTDLPDYLKNVDPDIAVEDRHRIILRLAKDYPSRKDAHKRLDLLNAAGVTLQGGKPFETTKQVTDQINLARQWAKKTGYKS